MIAISKKPVKTSVLKNIFLILLGISTQYVCAQTKTLIPASDSNIVISGRTDRSDPNAVIFAFPGVSIKAKFEGTSIDALLTEYGSGTSTTTNYFNVIIDGGTPTVLKMSSSQSVYSLASGLTDGVHTVELFKRTESNVGKIAFKGFTIDEGKKLRLPDALPKRKIEFIGNSITCGYGNGVSTTSPDSYHFTSANENNYKAWGAVAARSLNAQYSCVAYSGRGLYRNNTGATAGTLPLIYDETIADDASSSWNHYNYIPDVIVINLGTNDFSAEVSSATYKVDSATFVKTYIDFITKLRGYYPNASFVCCVGTMMSDYYPVGGKHWTRIQYYVSSVRTYFNNNGDSKVYYLKLEPQSSPYGEDWHPTEATDQIMANTLVSFINTNITWNGCPGSVELGNDINLKYVETPITLNSHSSSNTNVTYSWFKDGTLLNNQTTATMTIVDTTGASGIYKVVRDSANCKYEDVIKLTNTLRSPGTICKWLDNKKASVVLTFDDWSAGHPAIVVPEFKKRNMTGTFFVISSTVSNWTPILNAAKDGNEIGNHTKTHPDITKLTTLELDAEVKYTDSVINKNIPIQKVSTFDYPYGTYNSTVIKYLENLNYLGARGVYPSSGNYTYNFAPTIDDYFKVLTFAMTSTTSITSYGSELKNIIKNGGMLTVLYHSVNSPTVVDNNYAMVAQSDLQQQLDTIQSLRSKVWVTTFANALKYHREVRCASLVEVASPTTDKWVINLTDTITDSVLYNQPLSIILRLSGKKYDMIKQGGKILKIDSVFNDTIMFKAVPNKGNITLSVSRINVKSTVTPLQSNNTNNVTMTCSVEATSAAGIKEVFADFSAIGGDTTTVLIKTSGNIYTAGYDIAAATATGYKNIEITVVDSAGNVHIEKTGITLSSGIVLGAIKIYQTADSIGFSITATDDSQISSITANLTAVNAGYATTLKKMNADSFYVSVSRASVTAGSKNSNFIVKDNTGNTVQLFKTFTLNPLTEVLLLNKEFDLQISPNPAKGLITLRTKLEIQSIAIYNMSGVKCLQIAGSVLKSNNIDVSPLPEGNYVCAALTDKGLIEKQFIIQK